MKKVCLLALLLCFAVPCLADSAVQTDRNAGYIDVATPTFSIGTSTATDIGINVPAGCRGFQLTIFGGACVVGHPNDISTGPIFIGTWIASGTSMTWSGHDAGLASFTFYGKMTGADVGTGTICAW